MSTKFCQHCGETIDQECVVCPKCGKQVKELGMNQNPNVVINNSSYANAAAVGGATNGGISPKNKLVALLLAIFLGGFGIHRFYVGKIGTGIIWLCTGAFCGIGWIYDIIKIATGTFKDGAGRVISK